MHQASSSGGSGAKLAHRRTLDAGGVVAGRWVIDRVLGNGGMGRVYLAHHRLLGRKVAVKVLSASLTRDRNAVARFVGEARAACEVNHPNVVDVFDFGLLPDGRPFYVMEYLDGVLLSDLLSQRTLSFQEVCRFGWQIADALAAIHRRGVVHRDLTTTNVMVVWDYEQNPGCKIFDFGIARSGAQRPRLTPAGSVLGTPAFMSPEQCLGKPVDHRTDVYALGVLLHVLAARRVPFGEGTGQQLMEAHVSEQPELIIDLASGEPCPYDFSQLVSRCLVKNPAGRIQHASFVRDELLRWAAGGPRGHWLHSATIPPPAPQPSGTDALAGAERGYSDTSRAVPTEARRRSAATRPEGLDRS